MRSRWLAVVAMSGLWVGCGGPAAEALNKYKAASLASETDVQEWAERSSAPNIYAIANVAVTLVALTGGSEGADPNCPVEKKDGKTTRITGGCTDKNGVEWIGSMELVSEEEGESSGIQNARYTYDNFGYQKTYTCGGKTGVNKFAFHGTTSVTGTKAKKEFAIDVRLESSELRDEDSDSCETLSSTAAWEYKGTVDGADTALGNGRQTWNGSGRMGSEERGVVEVATKDEVVDDSVCDDEAASGSTTIKSGGHTAVITYDGATDCEEASTVQWSLDGKASGEMEGVSCSAASGPTFAAWGVALLGALGLMRRRARR
ncbi:hypothetical protein BO221_26850 [Archangium sp. Cb G35]|uniref:hypothetical protein n=1 Tax=Archangium sp. Cb G35 TaxID=1920190 RepID=UPI000937BDDD|nr:hypothetical protein [Archangium sp. Cb G35]OJT21441.1 hypothetical protein BO221_26850 [Archangium sp. Cb G35]